MTPKDKLIQELDNVSEPLIVEVLDFLQFLQAKQEQDREDILDARAALSSIEKEGTVSWDELKTEVGLWIMVSNLQYPRQSLDSFS